MIKIKLNTQQTVKTLAQAFCTSILFLAFWKLLESWNGISNPKISDYFISFFVTCFIYQMFIFREERNTALRAVEVLAMDSKEFQEHVEECKKEQENDEDN